MDKILLKFYIFTYIEDEVGSTTLHIYPQFCLPNKVSFFHSLTWTLYYYISFDNIAFYIIINGGVGRKLAFWFGTSNLIHNSYSIAKKYLPS